MAKAEIRCPSCNKVGKLEIAEDSIKNILRGLLAVNVAPHIICEHSFIVYIDKNLQVRDYFVADFQVELPNLQVKTSRIPIKDIVDIDLIKLNLHAITLTYIIKSIFSKQKIVFISEQTFLYEHYKNFFEYIAMATFDLNILVMNKEDYLKNKKQYKEYMVFEGNNILRNYKKFINPKKLDVEKQIVNQFITETELGYSYIALRNEIHKAYELAKSIVDFVGEQKKTDEILNVFNVLSHLEKLYNVKIKIHYSNFLIDIVKNYFGLEIPSASESFLVSL